MDVALELLDPLVFDKAYAWALPHPGAGFGTNSSDVNNMKKLLMLSIYMLTFTFVWAYLQYHLGL